MDINEILNQIIFKYHLDKHYPHYRNMHEAYKILRSTIREIILNNRKVIIVGNDETGIAIIRNMSRDYSGIQFACYGQDASSLEQLNICWEKYEKVYLISYDGSECAEKWFRMHGIKYEWIYDIFERKGIYLQRVFYILGKEDLHELFIDDYKHVPHMRNGLTESIQCELYNQHSKYENSNHADTRRIALEKCLFLSLYMRNFKAAHEYVTMLIGNFRDCQHIENLWKEILDLFSNIKKRMDNRKEKDIVLYWLDAIPYGDQDEMPYLQDIMQESVVFENAFTYVANTHPTMRAMFLGKKEIDDEVYSISKITRDNSPVIQYLEKQGYEIKIFSSYFDNTNFPWQYLSDEKYIYPYETFSEKLWGMLSYMLSQKVGKTFCIVHAMDAHEPCIHSMMNDDNCKVEHVRYRLARFELDRQLAFYDAYLCENALRIYMSDHGRKRNTIHNEGKLRFHILFNIYHRTLQPKEIVSLFSLLDFGVIVRQIIERQEIDETEFERDYVEIGQLDWYNRIHIERICRNKIRPSIRWFGYKGVVDKEYIYVRYKFGKEWLQRRDKLPEFNPQLFYDHETDICDFSLLSKYRQLVGEYPKSIERNDQFKYSKYLYAIYQNVLQHNNIDKCIKLINQILSPYPDGSIGIRMGGIHSEMLYGYISEKNRKKIWGFIDSNVDCPCSKLQLPIINPDWLNSEKEIKVVLLSSFDHLDLLRTEMKTYRADIIVLDLYKRLAEEGIVCKTSFWESGILDEDFDVGFPFA